MSCVNLSEVLQKADQHGVRTEGLEHDLEALGVEFRDFDLLLARPTAQAWSPGAGLSLGDRACLALADQVAGTAVTTDARWVAAGLDVDIRVLR
jgi:ribonuclease VapC